MQGRNKKAKKPGRPAAGKALTANAVAEAAAKLIDSEGLEKFSMRRLGQALGVEAMALYNHFEDKEAILDAVANLTLTGIPAPSAKGPWRKRVKRLGAGIRSLAREHPNLFRLAMTRRAIPGSGLPLAETVLTAFAEAGLSTQAQAIAYHTCFLYIRAFGLWEIEEVQAERDRDLSRITAASGNHPHTSAARQWILAADVDRLFEGGLDMILRGIVNPK